METRCKFSWMTLKCQNGYMITKSRRTETLKRTWMTATMTRRCPHWNIMRTLTQKTRMRTHQRISVMSAKLEMMETFSCYAIRVTTHATCTVASQSASVCPRVTGSVKTAKKPRKQQTLLRNRHLNEEKRETLQAMTRNQHLKRRKKMHQKGLQRENRLFAQRQSKPLKHAQEEPGQREERNDNVFLHCLSRQYQISNPHILM
mmetsp:Transcript_4582/g.9155  ORF Transcript_4582/g.9155 Transcript_4582/m.9155 type:complete len:203 (+) Transcript_4582:1167-1775(+)